MLNSLSSVDGQRGCGHAIDEFVDWYCSEPRLALNRTVVLRYRSHLEARLLAPGTINLGLGAVRRLAWRSPDGEKLKGKRDRALLALLLACGLRRHEGVGLKIEHLKQREERWAVVDLKGKRGHIRTVPVPWRGNGRVASLVECFGDRTRQDLPSSDEDGRILGEGMTEKAVWHIVKHSAKQIGMENLAPHDFAEHF